MNNPYSVVITSCNRFDLLEKTLRSLHVNLTGNIQEIVLIEDSDNRDIFDLVKLVDPDIRVIFNDGQLGQIASIDKAYSQLTAPYIFHCEDDWLFSRSGFIEESYQLLQLDNRISMVSLRPRQELNPLVRETPVQQHRQVKYLSMNPSLHPEYFSYSFNPGLRRLSDYQKIGPFIKIGHEADISYEFKKHGFYMACLENSAVQHIGETRHIQDPTMPPRARNFFQKLKNSYRKRYKRLRRNIYS